MAGPRDDPSLDFAHFRVLVRTDGNPWVLGIGGMGMTYKARDTRLKVEVALKVIHPTRLGDAEAYRLFVREARAAARVNDPHVASVVFLDDASARPFYVMEFVPGISLQTWLTNHGPAPTRVALACAEQIAHGLAAIHQQGIVHRDLKPSNVMVIPHPPEHPRYRLHAQAGGCQLKIIDFGLARGIAQNDPIVGGHDVPEPTVGFRGTAAYSSPEQCDEAANLDVRSDQYALGCILWQMLVGQPPFTGKSHREIVNQQVSAQPPWKRLKGLPEPVLQVLRRLLSKRREERFPDASLAAEALHAAAGEVGVDTVAFAPAEVGVGLVPATRGSTLSSMAFTSRWWKTAVASALFLVLGAGGAFWLLRRSTGSGAGMEVARRRVIAIVPFQNRSMEGDTEHFAEGVHEDILTSLSKVRALRVVAVKSSTKTRNGREERRDFVEELGVGSVLEGSVRRQGSMIRVTTQLSDARSGRQLWANTFDCELTDVFEIQSAVAREISRSLEMTLSSNESENIGRPPTRSQEAYELFLRARSLQRRAARTELAQAEVRTLFERALKIDPEFALAHAYLSRAHSLSYLFALDQSAERVALMRQSAERALALQPGLPEAHVALGRVLSYADRQHDAALRQYQVALAIEPGNAEALLESGHVLRRLGRWEEALRAHRQAAGLEPDDPDKVNSLGTCLFSMRRYAEAEGAHRRGAALSENPFRALNVCLAVLEQNDDWESFVREAKVLIPLIPPDQRWRIQRSVGDLREALATLRALPGTEVPIIFQRLPKSYAEGMIQRALGNRAEAELAFQGAAILLRERVTNSPSDAALRMKFACALAGSLAWKEAQVEAERALREVPEGADAVMNRDLRAELAQLYAEIGEPVRACDILTELLAKEMPLTLGMLRNYPDWTTLRGHPAFEALLARR